jgi:glycolate oxidase
MTEQRLQHRLYEVLPREQVLTAPEELACYGYDAGPHILFQVFQPQAAVLAKGVADVQKTLAVARELKVPVIPRGGGTGQAGGVLAPTGGICLDLSGWKTIEEIRPKDYQVFVRPGVTSEELNKALAPHGLYLPPDPSSGAACTLGGMVANNTSGQRSLKYGPIGQYVMGLEVVLPDGKVVTLGGKTSRVIKNVSGLDLSAGLFIGSEGTLGVITGIRLKAVPIPPARAGILYCAAERDRVPELIRKIYEAKVVFSACEFVQVQPAAAAGVAANLHGVTLPTPLQLVLLMEFEGNPASVAWELAKAKEIAAGFPGTCQAAEDQEQMQHLWWLLDEAEGGVMSARPGAKRVGAGEDIVVPPSRLVEALDGLQRLMDQAGIACVNFGHAVFANIHTGLLIRLDDPEEMKRVEPLIDDIHQLALSLEGSTTGEHGTGLARRDLLAQEHGQAAEIMKQVKTLLDPDHLLNPGKVFPDQPR